MSVGSIKDNNVTIGAQAPIQVFVSDGTLLYVPGHPFYGAQITDGHAVVNCKNLEYSEFTMQTDRDVCFEPWKHNNGSRYRLIIHRPTTAPFTLSWLGEEYTYLVKGDDPIVVLVVEVISVGNMLVNRVVASSTGGGDATLEKDISCAGVSNILGWPDGKTFNAGMSVTEFLEVHLRRAVAPTYITPSVKLTSTPTKVVVGSLLNTALKATFTAGSSGGLDFFEFWRVAKLLQTSSSNTYTDNNNFRIGEEYITYTVKASYMQGEVKDNNLGEPDESGRINAGVATRTSNVQGSYLVYATTQLVKPETATAGFIMANNRIGEVWKGQDFSFGLDTGGARYIAVLVPPGAELDLQNTKSSNGVKIFEGVTPSNRSVPIGNGETATYKLYENTTIVPWSDEYTFNIKFK